jgi:hypothetical protein
MREHKSYVVNEEETVLMRDNDCGNEGISKLPLARKKNHGIYT